MKPATADPPVMVVALDRGILRALRGTFPSRPYDPEPPRMRRRGALLVGDGVSLVDLADHRDQSDALACELAWFIGVSLPVNALLLVADARATPSDAADRGISLATRIDGDPRAREIIPDIVTELPTGLAMAPIRDRALHAAATWAGRRLPPHAVWALSVTIPPASAAGSFHRTLRGVVDALRSQCS